MDAAVQHQREDYLNFAEYLQWDHASGAYCSKNAQAHP